MIKKATGYKGLLADYLFEMNEVVVNIEEHGHDDFAEVVSGLSMKGGYQGTIFDLLLCHHIEEL